MLKEATFDLGPFGKDTLYDRLIDDFIFVVVMVETNMMHELSDMKEFCMLVSHGLVQERKTITTYDGYEVYSYLDSRRVLTGKGRTLRNLLMDISASEEVKDTFKRIRRWAREQRESRTFCDCARGGWACHGIGAPIRREGNNLLMEVVCGLCGKSHTHRTHLEPKSVEAFEAAGR